MANIIKKTLTINGEEYQIELSHHTTSSFVSIYKPTGRKYIKRRKLVHENSYIDGVYKSEHKEYAYIEMIKKCLSEYFNKLQNTKTTDEALQKLQEVNNEMFTEGFSNI